MGTADDTARDDEKAHDATERGDAASQASSAESKHAKRARYVRHASAESCMESTQAEATPPPP